MCVLLLTKYIVTCCRAFLRVKLQYSGHINPPGRFLPKVTMLRSGLCYRKSVCLSSVTFVRPTPGVETFDKYFFVILYLSHPLTSVHNFTEVISGEPLHQGVKRKRGIASYHHTGVSHLLVSFMHNTPNVQYHMAACKQAAALM